MANGLDDLWDLVFWHCGTRELCRAAAVCTHWRPLCGNESLWYSLLLRVWWPQLESAGRFMPCGRDLYRRLQPQSTPVPKVVSDVIIMAELFDHDGSVVQANVTPLDTSQDQSEVFSPNLATMGKEAHCKFLVGFDYARICGSAGLKSHII